MVKRPTPMSASRAANVINLLEITAKSTEVPIPYHSFSGYYEEFIVSHFPWNPEEMKEVVDICFADPRFKAAAETIKANFNYDIVEITKLALAGE